ncbi:hypothetical protein [Desulfosarcina ovata]|uniref:C4-dicarboxylate ABC transporter substrate-binding protein n=1 Tax=Desulfosarcina ovata subsp. ovata TaxID=2752305 RepID=A0A5K8ACJ8_9BACT|nr:hypothetical protein [Desulfosarcina ovata]BBO90345.1 hypothetical protein DSCOOX_35250 [Desulfosarcina ovata subsp. ovata]
MYAERYWVGNVYTFYAVMNKDKWDKLPENIKNVFEEVNSEFIEKMAQGWNQIDLAGTEFFKSKGGKVIQLSDAEAEKWNNAVEPVIDAYCQEMEKVGLSTAEIKDRIAFIKKTRDEYAKIQADKGIPMPYAE